MKSTIERSNGRETSCRAMRFVVLLTTAFAAAGCAEVAGAEPPNDEDVATTSEPLWANGATGILGTYLDGVTPIRMCRARYLGGYHPGYQHDSSPSTCIFSYGGSAIGTRDQQGLTLGWASTIFGIIPDGARSFPQGNREAYLCNAIVFNSRQVGSVNYLAEGCDIGYGGKVYRVQSYNMLLDDVPLRFVPVANAIPGDMVAGGFDTNGAALYMCAAEIDGAMRYGKRQGNWSFCAIPYNGVEVNVGNFQVLVTSWAEPNGTFWRAGNETNGEPIGFCRTVYNGVGYLGKLLTNGHCNIAAGVEVSLTDPSQFSVLRHVP